MSHLVCTWQEAGTSSSELQEAISPLLDQLTGEPESSAVEQVGGKHTEPRLLF